MPKNHVLELIDEGGGKVGLLKVVYFILVILNTQMLSREPRDPSPGVPYHASTKKVLSEYKPYTP